ncbi:DUF1778 domain-containing protein [Streptosporangium sandarakinum]|uniref:type II toxin-antitoxin system TacA family antitoxin n=1 Tax=Streptosporangium sandarakinum TaxID=1260955 RepID=UPI003423A9A2
MPDQAERRWLFEAASAVEGGSVPVLILDAATIAAEHVLADRTVFRPSEERWAAFDALSSRSARDLPRLCELLGTPTVLDEVPSPPRTSG